MHDPAKIIGQLEEPLLRPEGNEREGYVPNVVYSCGSLVHNGQLILPYGAASVFCGGGIVRPSDCPDQLRGGTASFRGQAYEIDRA